VSSHLEAVATDPYYPVPDIDSKPLSLHVQQIGKSYGSHSVINELSLDIEAGSFVALLGPNGSGKTTLLRILAGIEKPQQGRVYYDGIDVTDLPVQERKVAFVYQQYVNYPSMSVFENIASPLRVGKEKLSESQIREKVREVSELLGLTRVLQQLPEEVSGGQRQRCAIARALVKDARFIFLDEPLANLDYKLREELRTELKQIFKRRDGVVVYATPEPIDALMMASHVAYIHEGAIMQYGEVMDVYRNPSHAAVGKYFCHPQMNLIPCEVERSDGDCLIRASAEIAFKVELADEKVENGRYTLGIRPHHLTLSDPQNRLIPFRATVELAEVVGSDTELHLKHEDLQLTLLMQQVEQFPVGEKVIVYLDPNYIFLFESGGGAFVAGTNPG